MSTIVVRCANGHRFPVNTEKHKDRDHRLCPSCGVRVDAKKIGLLGKEFQPDPNWQAKKERAAEERLLAQRGYRQGRNLKGELVLVAAEKRRVPLHLRRRKAR